jgi:hypothetical protein
LDSLSPAFSPIPRRNQPDESQRFSPPFAHFLIVARFPAPFAEFAEKHFTLLQPGSRNGFSAGQVEREQRTMAKEPIRVRRICFYAEEAAQFPGDEMYAEGREEGLSNHENCNAEADSSVFGSEGKAAIAADSVHPNRGATEGR